METLVQVAEINREGDPASERAPFMGYVLLGDDPGPLKGKPYNVVPADSLEMANIPYPPGPERYLDIDVLGLYSGEMPDVWGSNEGILKIQVDTRPPQQVGPDATASFASQFVAGDHEYAGGYLYRGLFRNVIVADYVNLRFGLIEVDTDASVYLDKIQGVLKDVPEITQLDVLKGIPYLEVGTKLVESVIRTFGRNPNDQLWSETPILSIDPLAGGAFMRRGIYVVFDRGDYDHFPESMVYQDTSVIVLEDQLDTTHLVFTLGLRQRT